MSLISVDTIYMRSPKGELKEVNIWQADAYQKQGYKAVSMAEMGMDGKKETPLGTIEATDGLLDKITKKLFNPIVPINIIPEGSFPTRQNTGGGNMQMPNSSVGGSAVSPWSSQNADNMISMGIMVFFLMMIMSFFKRG